MRDPAVAQAAADFRWTGSWYTVSTPSPGRAARGRCDVQSAIADWLERYRVIGHDLQVDGPALVPLRIDMAVCVRSTLFPRRRREDAAQHCSAPARCRTAPRRSSIPTGQLRRNALPQSDLCARPGRARRRQSVEVTQFERLYQPGDDGLRNWQLVFGPDEIARCDNDPNYPEHGVLTLTVARRPMSDGAADCGCDCGACAGVTQSTPVIIDNTPGLTHVSARIGIYSSFLDSMIAGLSDSTGRRSRR